MDISGFTLDVARLGFSRQEAAIFDKKRKQQFEEILKQLEKRKNQGMRFWQALYDLVEEKGNLKISVLSSEEKSDAFQWEGFYRQDFDMIPEAQGYGIFIDKKPKAFALTYESAISQAKNYVSDRSIEFRLMTEQEWKKLRGC